MFLELLEGDQAIHVSDTDPVLSGGMDFRGTVCGGRVQRAWGACGGLTSPTPLPLGPCTVSELASLSHLGRGLWSPQREAQPLVPALGLSVLTVQNIRQPEMATADSLHGK